MAWRRVWWPVVFGLLVGAAAITALSALLPALSLVGPVGPTRAAGSVADHGEGAVAGPSLLTAAQAEEVADAVTGWAWLVLGEGCEGPMRGAGFVVDGQFVTNRHLVEGAETFVAIGSGPGQGYRLTPSGFAPGQDLALAPTGRTGGLALAPADPPIGAGVVMVGASGAGLDWQVGRVHQYTAGAAYGVDGVVMLVDPAAGFGYSGGPIVDAGGEVVGILRAMDTATDLGIAVPVSELERWLLGNVNESPTTSCDNHNG